MAFDREAVFAGDGVLKEESTKWREGEGHVGAEESEEAEEGEVLKYIEHRREFDNEIE